MFLKEFLVLSTACLMIGCSNYRKLILTFKEGNGFEEEMQIELKNQKIGYVSNIKIYKENILLKVVFDSKIKIPTGSEFIMYEPLIGHPVIEVLLSNNKTFLSSKDTVQGIFKTIKPGQ